MSYKNLGKRETPVTHLVSYVGEHFIISYNELNGNYTLYQLDVKSNSLTKVKGGQTPLEYDKIVYSKGKPPKLKDYIEEDYSDTLVYSSTWNKIPNQSDIDEKKSKSESTKASKSEPKNKTTSSKTNKASTKSNKTSKASNVSSTKPKPRKKMI